MATHKIGKLKFNLSRQGFAYRWGEGEIKRIAFGRDASRDEGHDAYAQPPYDEDSYGYPPDDSDYRADDYAPDDGYEDENGYYDDGGYYTEDEARAPAGPVMEYIENNAWVVLALLVVLPPLGIYLLWRLNRYDFKIRAGLSAVSAVWFIVLLVLIFSRIFGGGSDTSSPPQMTLVTTAPTVAPTSEPSAEPTGELGATETVEPDTAPTATPLANLGDNNSSGGETVTDTTQVYSPQTGLYYHSDPNCSNIEQGVSLTVMTVAAARNRSQTACPLCIGTTDDTVYYATKDGNWYHTDKFCQGMKNAVPYTKAEAEAEGKTACPVCAGGTSNDTGDSDNSNKSASEKYLASIKNDKSGVYVYMTTNGKYFHTRSDCSNMSGAKKVTLLAALQSGKPGCPVCAAGANKKVYATENGKWYHTDPDCQGMKNAKSITLAAALVLGKKKCPVCVTDDFYSTADDEASQGDEVFVYATQGGKYYHTNSTCSGMSGAEKVTLLSMVKAGRDPCPICAASATKKVYVTPGGQYYHSYATCSGMTSAQEATLAQALAYGFTACPKCWSASNADGNDSNTSDDNSNASEDGNSGYSGVYVYATENGKYYHTKTSCSKIDDGATKVLLEQAIDDGKEPCPECAAKADDTVYAQKGNPYYHKTATCSGMTDAVKGTLAEALIYGLKKCPICYGSSSDPSSSDKYVSGTSGLDVYATAAGKYYHTKQGCSNITGTPIKISLETALNYGKDACPICASSGDKTVYATKGGKYYHYSSSCAGSSASKGTLDQALALGFLPCPNCVTGSNTEQPTNSGKYTSGTSGLNVYVSADSKYFHAKANCGDLKDMKKTTLETALNYDLKPCPDCAAIAAKTVYAVSGTNLYHYDKSCAGSDTVSGSLAEALAYGLKPCPICVSGEGSGGDSGGGEESSAPADTTVYIDLSGDSSSYLYHTSATCDEAGMTDGTAVTLQYALEHGYSDCGFCNPPQSISD